jgi:L-rhamnonate dehydratase
MHFLANHHHRELLEYSTSKSPLRWETTEECIVMDADGLVAVPMAPGLRMHLNPAAIERYRVGRRESACA